MIQTRKSKDTQVQWYNRNVLLDEFFKKIGMDVVLIGDANNPAPVYNDHLLSCYVHNYTIHFTNKFNRGKDMYSCRVDEPLPDIDLLTLWYKNAKHDKAYRIKVVGAPLFVCGTAVDSGKPVFGETGFHYYLTQDFAQYLIDKFHLRYCEII